MVGGVIVYNIYRYCWHKISRLEGYWRDLCMRVKAWQYSAVIYGHVNKLGLLCCRRTVENGKVPPGAVPSPNLLFWSTCDLQVFRYLLLQPYISNFLFLILKITIITYQFLTCQVLGAVT